MMRLEKGGNVESVIMLVHMRRFGKIHRRYFIVAAKIITLYDFKKSLRDPIRFQAHAVVEKKHNDTLNTFKTPVPGKIRPLRAIYFHKFATMIFGNAAYLGTRAIVTYCPLGSPRIRIFLLAWLCTAILSWSSPNFFCVGN
jgi:hypothetical protein